MDDISNHAPTHVPSQFRDKNDHEYLTEIGRTKKRIAVIGFGMVGVAFVEKLLKYDVQGGRDEWEITIFGEEPHLAYNRVGLTQYLRHRSIESLQLNPLSWYSSHAAKLHYHLSDGVIAIDATEKIITTMKGLQFAYDECILATGSDAALPPYMPKNRFDNIRGTFVYRNVKDLEDMIQYAGNAFATHGHPIRKAAVVGGGLLGLEAAKALSELDHVDRVILVERNDWVLSRQLDQEGGTLVLEKVKALGIDVLVRTRIKDITVAGKTLDGLLLQGNLGEPDQVIEADMLVFAIGITPRDDLAEAAGLNVAERGGFVVNARLQTNQPNIYAIGECASWLGECFGLIAPGVEMAEVLAFNLTEGKHHKLRDMKTPDVSTRLKLMGVDVASFGDFFADKGKLNKPLPGSKTAASKSEDLTPDDIKSKVKALIYRDPFSDVYKKYIFTADGKHIVGGMMVGDVSDFVTLVGLCKTGTPVDKPPGEFIIGAKKEGEEEGGDLPAAAQICSCHNVTKGDIVSCVKKGIHSFGAMKASTKCGMGCGGCAPLATNIFNGALKAQGVELSNNICKDFVYSRQELYQVIKFKRLTDFTAVMRAAGVKADSLGCEVCRPAIGSILSSLYNDSIMKPVLRQTQDTNDRYLANIQRDGSYSVVPRLPAGEVTPAGLKTIADIAGDYNLYTKITGGQRIDMFGAKKQDLPRIWERLVDAGFESGHAYGKSLRTVKSCVGSSWCRFGVGDSVGLAVELEQRYKGLRGPHKIKGGVSGCVRECAEAQGKDFGLIGTPQGWNVYLGGNGGAKPRHADLIVENVTRREAVRVVDRFLILYIRSADKLERTARWMERYPGGLKALKDVIVNDKLGICVDLDKEMDVLVGLYHCEWTNVVRNKDSSMFQQFANTDDTQIVSEKITERKQQRPVDWPQDSTPLHFNVLQLAKDAVWEWRSVCKLSVLHRQADSPSSVTVKYGEVQLAIWNLPGRGLRAAQNMCPHRRAFVLADGLVGEDEEGREYVSCPLHKRNFLLNAEGGGKCSDENYSIMTFEAKADEEEDALLVLLPQTEVLDSVLATDKWMLKKAKEEMELLLNGDENVLEISGPKAGGHVGGAPGGGGCSVVKSNGEHVSASALAW